MQSHALSDRHHGVTPPRPAGHPWVAVGIAVLCAAGFYGGVAALKWTPLVDWAQPLDRYFAGHPVAIAATILFCGAIGILSSKYLHVLQQRVAASDLHDNELTHEHFGLDGDADLVNDPSDQFRLQHDAGFVADQWLDHLRTLAPVTFESRLVVRLREVLVRRTDRGSGTAAGDDLRELGTRDADAAHDSLGLVRIIIWAIPMLGFLGTVIGITQTLGGLDFTDGKAAVDSLKIGLNVAFDTTALGLVLSVVAIFLQFPVERAEMELLAAIDARVGRIVSKHLPSQDAADDQNEMIHQLCDGIKSAVAQSMADQTKLWRSTIDEAQSQWGENHRWQHDAIVKAFEVALIPSLQSHAESFRVAHHSTAEIAGVVAESSQFLRQSTQSLQQASDRGSQQVSDAIADLRSTLDQTKDVDRAKNQGENNQANDAVGEAVVVLARAVDRLSRRLSEPTVTHSNAAAKSSSSANSSPSPKTPSIGDATRRAA